MCVTCCANIVKEITAYELDMNTEELVYLVLEPSRKVYMCGGWAPNMGMH